MKKSAESIPDDVLREFDRLRAAVLVLDHVVPLMPAIEIPRGFFGAIKAFGKIKTLPEGTRILFDEVRMKRSVPWYRVHIDATRVSGWVNSTAIGGKLWA